MIEKRPLIITFLGDFNILGALLLISTFFPFMERLGFSASMPDYLNFSIISVQVARGFIAIIIIIASYGYLKLKSWGYWLMVSIKLLYIIAWFISYLYNKQQYFSQYPLSTIIQLIFIVPTIKYFNKKIDEV